MTTPSLTLEVLDRLGFALDSWQEGPQLGPVMAQVARHLGIEPNALLMALVFSARNEHALIAKVEELEAFNRELLGQRHDTNRSIVDDLETIRAKLESVQLASAELRGRAAAFREAAQVAASRGGNEGESDEGDVERAVLDALAWKLNKMAAEAEGEGSRGE